MNLRLKKIILHAHELAFMNKWYKCTSSSVDEILPDLWSVCSCTSLHSRLYESRSIKSTISIGIQYLFLGK